jgi:hypothetical protein
MHGTFWCDLSWLFFSSSGPGELVSSSFMMTVDPARLTSQGLSSDYRRKAQDHDYLF